MSKRISVIVPTKNSSRTLEVCLKSIINQSYKDVELIVIDNSSRDRTLEIAQKYTDKVLQMGPERSAQRNYGVANSTGEYVLVIDSDMELTPDVLKQCVEKLNNKLSVHALIVSEESVGTGFWAQCKRLERSFYVGVSSE
jgi:glycosyltransferase involved in cell wall biosynthesis